MYISLQTFSANEEISSLQNKFLIVSLFTEIKSLIKHVTCPGSKKNLALALANSFNKFHSREDNCINTGV